MNAIKCRYWMHFHYMNADVFQFHLSHPKTFRAQKGTNKMSSSLLGIPRCVEFNSRILGRIFWELKSMLKLSRLRNWFTCFEKKLCQPQMQDLDHRETTLSLIWFCEESSGTVGGDTEAKVTTIFQFLKSAYFSKCVICKCHLRKLFSVLLRIKK